MIFYLIHNMINNMQLTSEWSESKKNCFTLIIGGTLYVLLYVFLEYFHKITGNIFIDLLHKFFFYFVIIDAITMAILYKLYFGRSIFNETIPNEDANWNYDDETHKYKSKKNLETDEIRKFNQKSIELDDLHEDMDGLRDNMKDMADKTDQMEEAILCHPSGEMVQELKKDFNNLSTQQGSNQKINNPVIITDDDGKDST